MAVQTVFSGALGAGFAAGTPFFLYQDNTYVVLDFEAVVTVAASIEWFLEFTSGNPNDVGAEWYQETAQEDAGGGVVGMPKVLRTLQANGGGTLAAGTHRVSTQFVRKHLYARIQVRQSAGTVTDLTVLNVFGGPTS